MNLLKNAYLMCAVLWLALFFWSCSDAPPELFQIRTESDFIIEPGLDNLNTHIWILRDIPTRINLLTDENQHDLIDGIFAQTAVIETPFASFDFGLVNMAVINVWETGNENDKREVFFMDQFNNRDRERLQMFSSLSEVKDILLNDRFNAEVKIRFNSFTPIEMDARLTMNFVAHGK